MKRKLPTFHKSRIPQVITVPIESRLALSFPNCLEFLFRFFRFRRFPLPYKELIHVLEGGGGEKGDHPSQECASKFYIDVTSAKLWVVLLIGRVPREIYCNQSEALPKSRK